MSSIINKQKNKVYIKLLAQLAPVVIVGVYYYIQSINWGIKKVADNSLFIGSIAGLVFGIYKVKRDRQLTLKELFGVRGIRFCIALLIFLFFFFYYYNKK